MKSFFCGIFLLSFAYSLVQVRLTTNDTEAAKYLNAGDSIISTLGYFKATLQKSGCALTVYKFNTANNTYQNLGNYQSSLYSGDCNQLSIQGGMLVTDGGKTYLTAPNIAYNYSTIFTIDDQGVMRLISTYMMQNMVDIVSNQTVITQFQTNNNYLRAYSQFSVSFADTFNAIENERKWKFIAEFGQLTIYYGENPAIKLDYVYSTFTIRDSRIYDFSNQTFPGTLFTNISFQPRCNDPKAYLDFKPPYTLVANPYWPGVTVYEQGGYKILDIWLSKLSQYSLNQNKTQINYYGFYSPCPRRTFQYRGDCVASCPAPYYHQIKGESGFCVLNCQQYATVDESNRICSCVTPYEYPKLSPTNFIQSCPGDANQTPFGCSCKNSGYYYDGILTFSCVRNCPNSTFGINSVCMQCPANCLTCGRDNFNRQFLQCKTCSSGFTLVNGQCIVSCSSNQGYSLINGTCTKCIDPNCVDCSGNPNICLRCNVLYSLRSGGCVSQCLLTQLSVYSPPFSTSCLPSSDINCMAYLSSFYNKTPFIKCDQCVPGYIAHQDKCVTQCPSGYYALNGYCVCGGTTNNLTVSNQCLNQTACPIMMSFDIRSHSCISCPFGCLSCVNTQCTACSPGYFLYISPQSILCRKKSPLFPCNQQYSWQRNTTCAVTNYTDPNLGMTLCYQNVPNCQICIPHSNQICVLCQPNYYIYNNTCLTSCPQGLTPHDNTCILPQIPNCAVPHLLSMHKQAVITQNATQGSQAYRYYIYDNLETANDPVGYIPYFQQLTTQNNDGIPRQTDFFEPTWICLKCNDTFGLSDDFKSCLPCPTSCLDQLCYMARNDSCIKPFSSSCPENMFTDVSTGTCLQSCNDTSKYPYVQNGILYCGNNGKNYARVDSSVYQWKDGQKLVFFVFSDKLSENSSTSVTAQAFNLTKTGDTSGNNSNDTASSNTFSVPIVNGQYVQLSKQQYNAFLLNLSSSLHNLTGMYESVAFPNPIYGSVYLSDHTVFMTTWLAYIGYIMSIVVIVLHVVFIGNELLYKADNLLIFIQTIFFFEFVQNLVGRLLAQFYFGWSFAHARFLPNLFNSIIPDHYVETQAPVSYKLFNIDGNYFRNAGFSLAWVLIYLACWAVVTFFVWGIINKLLRRHQAWYPRVARQALTGGFQFFSMNLIFFSVSQLAYSGGAWQNGFQDYFDRSQTLAIITLIVMFVYTIGRLIYNPLGGLYMLKRSLIAVILVFSYNIRLLIIPLIALELLFSIGRHILQRPMTTKQKLFIWGESLLFIGCYVLLYFCVDAGVNSIILSVFIFIFIVYLAYDLTTIYLQSQNEFAEEQLQKQYQQLATDIHRAQTLNYISNRKISPLASGTNTINMDNGYNYGY